MTIRSVTGRQVLHDADHLAEVYGEVFGAPPWNKGADATAAFRERLARDCERPGFRAVISPGGFASGWRTRLPLPDSRAYPRVAAHLGPDRLRTLLDGAFEVDELAVRPGAQGTGLGRRLLTALVPAGRRAWLLTWREAPDAIAFYHRVGWQRVEPEPGVDSDLAIFVMPAGRD